MLLLCDMTTYSHIFSVVEDLSARVERQDKDQNKEGKKERKKTKIYEKE